MKREKKSKHLKLVVDPHVPLFLSSILMPCTVLLLHYDVNIVYVCVEGRPQRAGWEIRPQPKTVVLLINITGMPIFRFVPVIFGPMRSPISSFSFLTFCLFLCSFSVRWHVHVDFQLFSQKSSGITDINQSISRSHRLVGLVVKASASRAGDPGFESRLRQDFFGVESYQ